MLRTILIIVVLVVAALGTTGGVFLTRLRHEVTAPLGEGYSPRRSVYSSAFTDALWAHVEKRAATTLSRDVSILAMISSAAGGDTRRHPGLILASVAATSFGVAHHVLELRADYDAVDVLRELLLAQALLERFDADGLAALFAETARFGNGMIGIDVAAEQLYGKPAALLDAGEAASLLSMAWSEQRCDLVAVLDRRDRIYHEMQIVGLAPAGTLAPVLAAAVMPVVSTCLP